uniref:Mitochondrial carrier protein n=1 Tax=Heterorhabditis bacteriophora TaxID=37862 RepID=A0A1I7XT05_HETBA
MAADNANHGQFLGMNEEEEAFAKGLAAKALLTSAVYPLTCVKTLIQLGHEPFPLSTGKTLIVAGRNAYFLPNVFSYARQLANLHDMGVLFTGLDSAIFSLIVQGVTSYHTSKYIDKYYPTVGGAPENINAEEKLMTLQNLTEHQSFKRHMRSAIRDSAVRIVAVTAARPLTGIGLVPQIIGELIVIWGVHTLTYAADRMLVKSGMYENNDDKGKKDVEEVRKFINTAIPFVTNSFGYPYAVVSTVMAVAGSGLAVSFLPYTPSFVNWHNAWDYLRPHGLKRGARLFFREQTGAVSVGSDQQLYASNKHFF